MADDQAWFERLAAGGMVPDGLLRRGVRIALRRRLRALKRADSPDRPPGLRDGPVAIETEAANRQHYEVPTAFFRLVLGPRLKYSSGYWPNGNSTLAQAEDAMLELTARRAQLADGQRVLDLGSGWGAFSLWAAERYPSASFTAMSNSCTQREFIGARAAELGLSNIEVVAGNAAALELPGRFDRIVSVEMLEHVRNHGPLLAQLADALAPGGRIFVHVFSHRQHAYTFEPEDGWMARWFFSGGTMPSLDLFDDFTPAVRTVDRQVVSGRHYARTLRCWLRNLDRQRDTVREIFRGVYGDSLADLWIARWRLFFIACEELFAYRGGREWVVAHHLLAPVGRT
ncbi:MAG: cyclopropane-fatty-acyl-phospholipid synthase [Chloroflexota bacterium]|nr:cyclopropane-fatty-acyl-phospholipid synthase [Chloroflexota bacterium]MDE2920191.1 cyclopropane-fatty-acyl-phospholipid synthase [Chloroflexota bacterium]